MGHMRPLKKSINKNLQRSRLFLADLRSIYNILKNHYVNITIKTADYLISDFDELKKLGGIIHTLTFQCYDEKGWAIKLTIYFTNSYANIQMEEDTTLNRGILSEIEAIVTKRKQQISTIFSSAAFFYCFNAILIVALVWLAHIESTTLAFIVILIIAGFLVYWSWAQMHNYSIIALYEIKERPSFWARNKDRIIVGLIVGVIVAIVSRFFR